MRSIAEASDTIRDRNAALACQTTGRRQIVTGNSVVTQAMNLGTQITGARCCKLKVRGGIGGSANEHPSNAISRSCIKSKKIHIKIQHRCDRHEKTTIQVVHRSSATKKHETGPTPTTQNSRTGQVDLSIRYTNSLYSTGQEICVLTSPRSVRRRMQIFDRSLYLWRHIIDPLRNFAIKPAESSSSCSSVWT